MASYDQLVKDAKGTIHNTAANVSYSSPDQLAMDLGIKANQIQWGNIRTDANFKLPSAPVLTADTAAVTPVNVPTATVNTTPADTAIAGATQATKSLDQYIKEVTPTNTPEQQKSSELSNRVVELLGQTAGKTQAVAEEENRMGVPELSKELAQLNADSQRQVAEYNAIKANYEKLIQNEENKVQSLSKIRGAQGRIARDMAAELNVKASENAITTAQALGKQGMIEQAQKAAARSVDLRYAHVEEELAIKKAQLQALQQSGILNKQEAAQATALERKYNEEKEAIEEQKAKQKENVTLAVTNNVSTRFVNHGGEFFAVSDGKAFSDPASFFKAAGVSSFQEAYDKGLVTDVSGTDKVLSVAEANALNVPYGTTQREAMKMKITPQTASEARKSGGSSGGSSTASKVKATPDSIKSWVLENKRSNPDVPYYELWGMLSEELNNTGINPDNYDKIFWEMLHPEGLDGYKKYVTDANKKTESADPLDDIINSALKQSGI